MVTEVVFVVVEGFDCGVEVGCLLRNRVGSGVDLRVKTSRETRESRVERRKKGWGMKR